MGIIKKILLKSGIVLLVVTAVSFLILIIGLGSCLLKGGLSYKLANEEKYDIGYSDYLKKAFVGGIYIKEGDDLNIVLPDEYNGYHVTNLGGYVGRGVPTPFYVAYFPEDVTSVSSYDENENIDNEVIEIHVNITLPKYLEEIGYHQQFVSEVDEDNKTIKTYIVRGYYTIDESNEYFYTLDGKVYNKKTNELITAFIYEK